MTVLTDTTSPHAPASLARDRAGPGDALPTHDRRPFWKPETMRFGATVLGRLTRALHRSRRRQARRVTREHQHLIEAARQHPLVIEPAGNAPATAPHLSMRREAASLLAAVSRWRGVLARPRMSEQMRS